ncbi:hypothetical protein BDL97_14G105700 [Sphagnum fallax]|nr:hypothetical protein BDL97_14G105700 [Sphagnum fallax]
MGGAAKEIWKELVSNKMTATAEDGSFLSGRVWSLVTHGYQKQLMISPQRNSWILEHNSSFGVVEEVMKLLYHSRGTQKSFFNTILSE